MTGTYYTTVGQNIHVYYTTGLYILYHRTEHIIPQDLYILPEDRTFYTIGLYILYLRTAHIITYDCAYYTTGQNIYHTTGLYLHVLYHWTYTHYTRGQNILYYRTVHIITQDCTYYTTGLYIYYIPQQCVHIIPYIIPQDDTYCLIGDLA